MLDVMPESDVSTLVCKASLQLTAKDYEEVFIPRLEQLLKDTGTVRAVLYLQDGFTGWEVGAAWDDTKFGIAHRKDFTKLAIVGGPRWVQWVTNLAGHFISGEVKNFTVAELPEAITWAKA